MKNLWFFRISGLFAFFVFPLFFVQCEKESVGYVSSDSISSLENRGKKVDICTCIDTKFPKEAVSEEEISALVFMLEEEKLAGDLYRSFLNIYNTPIFGNISQAESRHQEALQCLLKKYELTDRVSLLEQGRFANEDLQSLYNDLLNEGKTEIKAALKVGATVEDLDLFDLQKHLGNEAIDNEDIKFVFGELMRGSRNHLRAYIRNLEFVGESYLPQYISKDDFTEIINGDQERGSQWCQGLNYCNQANKQSDRRKPNCAMQNKGNSSKKICQRNTPLNSPKGKNKSNRSQREKRNNG